MRGPAWDGVRRTARRVVPAIIIGFGLAGAQPAAAQFFGFGDGWAGGWGGGHWGGLRANDVGRAIADQGFRMISPLRRNGSVFVADVVDRRGRRERLIVAAADAQILQRFYLDDPRLPGFVPRNRMARGSDETNWENRNDVVPPASIPRSSRRPSLGADQDQSLDGNRQGDGLGQDDSAEPQRVRPVQKAPRQRPRVVDRTPDATSAAPHDAPTAMPARPQPKPSEATRDPAAAAPVNERPVETAPKVAARPPEPASTPSAPAAQPAGTPTATAPSPRMRDPLAIPGGEPKTGASKPAPRPSSAAVEPSTRSAPTPAPAPTPVAKAVTTPSKTGDVPVAPLD